MKKFFYVLAILFFIAGLVATPVKADPVGQCFGVPPDVKDENGSDGWDIWAPAGYVFTAAKIKAGPDCYNNGALYQITGIGTNHVVGVRLCTEGPDCPEISHLEGMVGLYDGCPDDPLKTEPGACGCGVLDTDTDGDGVPDCNDTCPTDPLKTAPGACGCGQLDTDTDGDGIADCDDNCVSVPNPDQLDSNQNGIGDVCEQLEEVQVSLEFGKCKYQDNTSLTPATATFSSGVESFEIDGTPVESGAIVWLPAGLHAYEVTLKQGYMLPSGFQATGEFTTYECKPGKPEKTPVVKPAPPTAGEAFLPIDLPIARKALPYLFYELGLVFGLIGLFIKKNVT